MRMTDIDNGRLSDAERMRMRNTLKAYMAEHPARAPFMVRALDMLTVQAAAVEEFMRIGTVRSGAAIALLIIFAGGSTSYAAQSALPGDALYPIKVGINEKVQLALARTPAAHAELDAEFAERRLQEAETLAVSGKLSPQISNTLASNLDVTAKDFNAQLATLATSSDNASAIDAQSNFEAALATQAQVLAAISTADPSAAPAVKPLQAKVHGHLKATRTSLAATSSKPLPEAAEISAQNALKASQQLQALVPQAQDAFGATSTTMIQTRASAIEHALSHGQSLLHDGNYSEALDSFQSAFETAQQTQTAINAGLQLKRMLRDVSDGTGQSINNGIAVTLMSSTSTSNQSTSSANVDQGDQ